MTTTGAGFFSTGIGIGAFIGTRAGGCTFGNGGSTAFGAGTGGSITWRIDVVAGGSGSLNSTAGISGWNAVGTIAFDTSIDGADRDSLTIGPEGFQIASLLVVVATTPPDVQVSPDTLFAGTSTEDDAFHTMSAALFGLAAALGLNCGGGASSAFAGSAFTGAARHVTSSAVVEVLQSPTATIAAGQPVRFIPDLRSVVSFIGHPPAGPADFPQPFKQLKSEQSPQIAPFPLSWIALT